MKALFWSIVFLAAFYSSLGQSFSSNETLNLVFEPATGAHNECARRLQIEMTPGDFSNLRLKVKTIPSEACPDMVIRQRDVQMYYFADQCGSLIYLGEYDDLGQKIKVQLVDHRTRLCKDKDILPGDFVYSEIFDGGYIETYYSTYMFLQGRLTQ